MRLIAVLDGFRLGFTRIPMHLLMFHCRAIGGELRRTRSSAGRRLVRRGQPARGRSPAPASGAAMAFAAIRGDDGRPYFDPPREPPWRQPDEPG